MRKNKKIQDMKIFSIIAAGMFFACFVLTSSAADGPNYGTTTFFSDKKDKPVLEKPILGASDNSNDGHDNDNGDDNDDGGGIVKPDDIFNTIGNTITSTIDNSVNTFNETKKSLFDFQGDFGSGGSSDGGAFNEKDEFFIAGPRGESPEYMASMRDSEANSQAVGFNFEDRSLKVAPKKSRLLFTNKEVAIDMTSQYVAIILIFIIAIGSAVGYYYWKREALKGKKEEDYD
jgi:hypothetical protein